jgi:hypothetical protein
MRTYRYADGSLVAGEYETVTSTDFFGDDGDFYEVIEERWELTGTFLLQYGPTDVWCAKCEADIELVSPTPPPHYCASCEP